MEILEAASWVRPQGGEESQTEARVAALFQEIHRDGDRAIAALSQRFDGFEPSFIALKAFEDYRLQPQLEAAIRAAAQRIERFARAQKETYRDFEIEDPQGNYGQRVLPLERMAAYIPGGRFPLLSTALMTLIPARVAGVGSRLAISPSDHPAVLAAAALAGATGFVRLGGAQAIAAAAFGLAGIEPVDMIVGPGNAYVNAAKALVQGRVKIDTLAGPSEILLLADGSVPIEWVVYDILAQAEHDPMALSVLACNDHGYLNKVGERLESELAAQPQARAGLVQLVYAPDPEALIAFSNRMAPEHLQLATEEGFIDYSKLCHYGSLFIGAHSAVALGDYCTGPNHTLPTLGHARQKGGLQVGDFLKIQTWQKIKPQGFATLAKIALPMAQTEGLSFHQKSLEIRTQST